MKKISTFLLTSLMAVSVFAADVTGRVSVSFTGNKAYEVSIDGRNYYFDNNTATYLNNIRPGNHTIEVYAVKNKGRKNNRPIYQSSFVVRPKYDLNILVDRNGRVQFDERAAYNNNRQHNKDWNYRDDDDRDRRYDNNDNRYGNNNGYGNNNNNGYGNNGYGNNNYNQAMNDADFSRFVQKIKSQWFGSSKVNEAKSGLMNSYFTTYQVRQVLQLFSSESEKLELAKLAYKNVVDQRSYTQLYDVFSSQSSRDELDRFTRDYRY